MSQRIYLDYNATTPLSEFVKAELLRILELDLGNPSSRHWAGTSAAEIVELSRIRVASLIGCDPTEIIFTSGGTEASNHALKGVFFANHQRRKQPHFIISSIEHPSKQTAPQYAKRQFRRHRWLRPTCSIAFLGCIHRFRLPRWKTAFESGSLCDGAERTAVFGCGTFQPRPIELQRRNRLRNRCY